jgi:periplasmic protein CpxP/Spy
MYGAGPIKKLLPMLLLAGVGLWAQQPGNPSENQPGNQPGNQPDRYDYRPPPPPPMQPNRPPMESSFRGKPRGRWWTDPALAKKLNLTDDQQKRMDALFQESRLKLIDLRATLEKQEVILRPLLEADQPNEGQVLAQIDKVAQARAELEKANARMLLGLRRVLTVDQWKQLQAMQVQRPMGRRWPDGNRGPRRPAGMDRR